MVARGGFAGGAAAGEEVEDEVPGLGVDADDALEDAEGFLGGVAGFFFAGGADDGVPPDVGGSFAAGGFGGSDHAGGHVGDAVGFFEMEGVEVGVAGVPEDVLVFSGPSSAGACAVVVGPDDLILERGAAEDGVEHDLDVVDFAGVDVDEEAAGGTEEAMGFGEAGAKEFKVVGKGVVVAGVWVEGGLDAVAAAPEAGAAGGVVADGAHAAALLAAAGVEGWVDVDEVDGGGFEVGEHGEIFAEEDAVGVAGFGL